MVLTLSRQFVTLTGTGKAVRVFFTEGLREYCTVYTLHLGNKNNMLVLYQAKTAVCSEDQTKHINAM